MVYPHETHPHLGAGHTDAIALGRKDLGEGRIFSPSEFTYWALNSWMMLDVHMGH